VKRKRQAAQVTIAAAGLTALWASIGAVGLALCLLVAAVLWLQVYAESGIGG
jgi:hypothetical protein